MQIHTVGGVDAILLFVVVFVCYITATFLTLDQVNGFCPWTRISCGVTGEIATQKFRIIIRFWETAHLPLP